MIKIEVNHGHVKCQIEGHRIEVLGEIPIIFGHVLKRVLQGAPDDLRDELLKTTIELTLENMGWTP